MISRTLINRLEQSLSEAGASNCKVGTIADSGLNLGETLVIALSITDAEALLKSLEKPNGSTFRELIRWAD